ncbi:MAG: Gfo/Idh/MocA family oxidoreductase [Firmicutes bacterium]|nr:Gfo/Idh/MocA family oxidoreductase [Bacillota bacterium]MDD4263354.1 Gfo/Idh/MocA family oxidoreductase [Bacillota bacterium]MDD4694456.1 Gfo/Idh/MocA family oxidoreductase [Bacillota bacterium]
MANKVKIGVVGAGAIAENAHLAGYALIPDLCEIRAICDVNKERAEEMAKKFNIPEVYTDHKEMLAKADIDAVSVCTPNCTHAPITIDACNAKKHVLCEKPMATTVEECEAMVKAAEANNVQLMVGFTHRFYNYNQKAKELIQSGVIGKPFMARVRFAHEGPYISWPAKSDWFFNKELAGGGALLDMGIHALDILRFLIGEIKDISANLKTLVRNIEVEDNAVCAVNFENGAMGYVEVGWSSKTGVLGIEIYGDDGSMIVDYNTPIRIYVDKKKEIGGPGWVELKQYTGGGWDAEMKAFVQAIISGTPVPVDGDDGLVGVKIATAAYKSNDEGRRVDVE